MNTTEITEESKPEPTIWRIPDDLWEIVEEILEREYPRHRQDRKRVPLRPVLDGVLYKLRTGCQWNQIPKEYGDDSTIHRHYQAWCELVIFDEIWRQLLLRCEELGGIQWEWQSADGSMGKAMGKSKMGEDAVGKNPTDRGKKGVKRSVVVEGNGGPLGVAIAGANIHDTKLLAATLDAIVLAPPPPTREKPQHLCPDKAYDNPTGHQTAAEYGYTAHIRRIGEERLDALGEKRHPARRWVVERTIAWLSKFRSVLTRYEGKAENYSGLVKFACILIWTRIWHRLKPTET